jgi:hypothetical protein
MKYGMGWICNTEAGEKDVPKYKFEYMKRQLGDLTIDGCLTYC